LKIGRSIRGIWIGTEGKTTIEYEPGMLKDLKAAIENIMVSDCHIMYIVTTAFVIMIPQSGIKIDYHLTDTEDWREGWKQRSVFIVVALLS